MNNTLSRRRFLSHSCGAMATATVSSTLLSLGAVRQAAAATPGDYKALVCILLAYAVALAGLVALESA